MHLKFAKRVNLKCCHRQKRVVMDLLINLVVVIISHCCTSSHSTPLKNHIQSKYIHFFCQSYLNKAIKTNKENVLECQENQAWSLKLSCLGIVHNN